jgi:hypothetical protein
MLKLEDCEPTYHTERVVTKQTIYMQQLLMCSIKRMQVDAFNGVKRKRPDYQGGKMLADYFNIYHEDVHSNHIALPPLTI